MVSLPSQISAFCALAARSPCICSHLRVALRFAQQPTGLSLPFGALRVALGLRPKCPGCSIIRASLRHTASVFARSIVAEGAGRAHRSFRGPPAGRFALRATTHRADASLRRPKACAAAQKASVASTRRVQETRRPAPRMVSPPQPGPSAPALFSSSGRVSPPARRNQQSKPICKGANAHDLPGT